MIKKLVRCTKCVMDTSDPEITFDESGICNYCRDYEKRKSLFVPEPKIRHKYIKEMVDYAKMKGKGKNYDCIIGVSGGVDSSYLAIKVKDLGLRPLAVHLDNGWDSELAVNNIHSLLGKLGIDLYTHVLNWEEFKSLQVAFLRASTPDSEIPTDHAIVALMRELAAKEDIPVIWGVNFSSESVLPKAWSQGHMNWAYIRKINKLYGGKKLTTYPHYSVFKLMYWNRLKRQRLFALLNYIEYDKEKAKKLLIEKFGWRDYGGKHHESLYTKFYQNYILPKKFGYDKRKAHYSSLILAGLMTREQALREMEKPLYNEDELKEYLHYVTKKLGLSKEDFEAIMSAPPKKYEDFAPTWPQKVRKYENLIFGLLGKIKRNFHNNHK